MASGASANQLLEEALGRFASDIDQLLDVAIPAVPDDQTAIALSLVATCLIHLNEAIEMMR